MAPQIKLTVTGAGALKLTLDQIVGKIARRAARRAVTEAGRAVLEEAKSRVPTDTGSLKKSLGIRVVALRNGGGYIAIIGPRYDSKKAIAKSGGKRKFGKWRRRKGYRKLRFYNPVKYAHLVEYGTRPHRTFKGSRSKSASQARHEKAGLFEHFSKHPGAVAKPFMRPAWDAVQPQANAIMKKRFKELMDDAVVVAK